MPSGPSEASWWLLASCRGLPVDLFIPKPPASGHEPAGAAQVRAVCEGCPVRVECGAFARETASVGWWRGHYRRASTRRR